MSTLNKVLKIFRLTWVKRNRVYLSTNFNPLESKIKYLLIYDYLGKNEKILFSKEK